MNDQTLNIYLINPNEKVSKGLGWDSYSSAVVIAPNESVARNISPQSGQIMNKDDWNLMKHSWANLPEDVEVEFLGTSKNNSQIGLILSSFHAG